MRLALTVLFTAIAHLPVYADQTHGGGDGTGIFIDGSSAIRLKNGSETISMVQTKTVTVNYGDTGGNNVVSLRSVASVPSDAPTPAPLDNRLPSQITDNFKTGFQMDQGPGMPPLQGLATSNSDPQGNVRSLQLPTTPPMTVVDPKTPEGKPVTPQMLAGVASGNPASLTVVGADGSSHTIGQPSQPQSG